ncbi:MAG TPA: helicase-related protein [Planctomycetota bacterium]|nr:helicase-related protein [Planctomycetota bacterium]
MIQPYTWQIPAVEKQVAALTAGPIVVNGSDTGTGKTICALATMQRMKRRFLVIAPKTVHTAWRHTVEAMNLTPNLFGIVNPERLLFKNDYYRGGRWCLPGDITIIWDEVHRGASGYKTKTTRALAVTKAFSTPILAMSATIADSPLKLRGLGFLLGLHEFNPSSFFDWCRRNGCHKSFHHDGLEFTKGPRGEKFMERIHKSIADKFVRLRIADIDDFPESQVLAELFDLETRFTKEINKIYAEMDDKVKNGSSNPEVAMLRARQKAELIKVPLLVELAEAAIDEGKSPVVFVNFRDTLAAFAQGMGDLGFECGTIFGGQDPVQQQRFRDRFQTNDLHCMGAMSQAGSVGIDLHDVHHARPRVSYITPSYNAVDMIQCLGRIHRTGGTKVVQTFVLIAGTIEERVHRAITRKLGNIKALNEGDLT